MLPQGPRRETGQQLRGVALLREEYARQHQRRIGTVPVSGQIKLPAFHFHVDALFVVARGAS